MLGNLYDFSMEKAVPWEKMPLLERYALYRLNLLVDDVQKYFSSYDFHKAFQEIHNYIVRFLSSIYLDVRKDVLYTYFADSEERRATQTVIFETLRALLILLFPMISFTAEEAWQSLLEKFNLPMSVAMADWPELNFSSLLTEEQLRKMEAILNLRDLVNDSLERAKNQKVISQPSEGKVIIAGLDERSSELLASFSEEEKGTLKEVLRVAELQVQVKLEDEALKESYDLLEDPKLGRLAVKVENPGYKKCQRCWNYYPKLSDKHPEICERCLGVLERMGLEL